MAGASKEARVIYVPAQMGRHREEEVDLVELIRTLWKGKWFILGFVLLSTLSAYFFTTYLITPVYQAKAVLRPTEVSGPVITTYLDSTHLKRRLVEKYDLLPILYPERWDDESKRWRGGRFGTPPTTELVLSEGRLPFQLGANYTLIWTGTDPTFNVIMLKRIIQELDLYVKNEFISDAQIQMIIYEQELAPLAEQFEGIWDQFWGLDKVNLAKWDVLGEYTRLKNRITDLKSQDALSRIFTVTGEPITIAAPISPRPKRITGLVLISSAIISICAVIITHSFKKETK
jgi:hypothetical protein